MQHKTGVLPLRHLNLQLHRKHRPWLRMATSKIDMNRTAVDSGTVADRLTSTAAAGLPFVDHLHIVATAQLTVLTIPMLLPKGIW